MERNPGRFAPNPVRPVSRFTPIPVRNMENTIANIRILDVVRLVHGYFVFVFLIMDQFRNDVALWVQKLRGHYDAIFIEPENVNKIS